MTPSSYMPLAWLLLTGCVVTTDQPLPEPGPRPVQQVPPDQPAPTEATQTDPEHGTHSPGSARGTHAVNLFLGGADQVGDFDGITVGLDYEYKLTPRWGVGLFAEDVTGVERSFATGVQGYWHATEELIFIAGPGFERSDSEWGPLARIGAVYEFEVAKQWVLAPAVFYDFTENDNLLIYGLNLGYLW